MVTICIPIYNFPVHRLLKSLERQKKQSLYPIEILLIDDGSNTKTKKENKTVCEKFRYIELNSNIGRAKIRNLFIKYAAFDYLLFLDCDSLIIKDDFLETYVNQAKRGVTLACGGRLYPTETPGREYLLRYKYGIRRESKPALERKRNPHRSFMTNNFLIQKQLIAQIGFDESIKGYGHEDTLFGIELQQKKIPIEHIENPVLNGGIETNEEFLAKTRQSIINLVQIKNNYPKPQTLEKNITLLKIVRQIGVLKYAVRFAAPLLLPAAYQILKIGNGSGALFAFYKLTLYIALNGSKNTTQ